MKIFWILPIFFQQQLMYHSDQNHQLTFIFSNLIIFNRLERHHEYLYHFDYKVKQDLQLNFKLFLMLKSLQILLVKLRDL